jgi:branched-chain amino acid transport system permease protein
VLIVVLPWLLSTGLSAIPMPADLEQRLSGNLSVLVFGALHIVVMLAWPGGLASLRRPHPRSRARSTVSGDSRGSASRGLLSPEPDAGQADSHASDAEPRHPEPALATPSAPPPQRKR